MLATLGPFVFMLKTAPYQQLQRTTQQRWAALQRVGKRARYQYLGDGQDTITLTGQLRPEITGGRLTLDALRAMKGKAWPFIDGEGHIYGLWFIETITETRGEMMKNGTARKIDFTISLKRADDTAMDSLGALTRSTLNLLRR